MDVNQDDILSEVEEAFERYEQAFQHNDLEVLDALFWDDARVVRFGVAEDNYGIDQVRAWRAAQPTADLLRTVTRKTITTFGQDAATAFIEFRRDASGIQGRQSQTWARTADGWKVVAAHVSHLAPAGVSVADSLPTPDSLKT
jgi:ketosteroid isomerase-like protein